MMKRIGSIAAVLLLCSQTLTAQESPVIGVVNLEQALFNTEVARELEADLRDELGDDERRLEQLNAELREIIQRAQRDESILSDAELRRLNADAEDKQVQLRVVAERLQEAWEQRQQQFVNGMRQNLSRAIEEVVQEGGYDLVLNAEQVAYFNNTYNITAQVTAKLNELTQ